MKKPYHSGCIYMVSGQCFKLTFIWESLVTMTALVWFLLSVCHQLYRDEVSVKSLVTLTAGRPRVKAVRCAWRGAVWAIASFRKSHLRRRFDTTLEHCKSPDDKMQAGVYRDWPPTSWLQGLYIYTISISHNLIYPSLCNPLLS